MNELKQVIVVRRDLNLSKGKTASQVAHASLEAWKSADEKTRRKWEDNGGKKVVLKVENEKELLEKKTNAEKIGIPTALIADRGLTEVSPGTKT